MSNIFFDTETCGLHGPIVLLQYAEDDGPIEMHSVWTEQVGDTIELIEKIVESNVIGFNLSFDWFHICQTYTTLRQFKDWTVYPEDHIDEYAFYEEKGRFGPCLKPQGAFDIMLHARKGKYQSTMNRDDIRIKRVPTKLAYLLADELDKRIPLKDIYFARKKNRKQRWQVQDIIEDDGEMNVSLKDIVLKFAPSSALKALAQDALGYDVESIKLFSEVEPPESSKPEELGYAPWALAVGKPGEWNNAWPDYGKIRVHISHWGYNKIAREYASDDVKYTRELYNFFGCPPINDDDSLLACMVGAVRWRGFSIDTNRITALRAKAEHLMLNTQNKFNFNSPEVCRKYLSEVLTETEKLVMQVDGKITTKGAILEQISKWKQAEVCDECSGFGCNKCNEGLVETEEQHPAAVRATEILDARHAKKEIELYDKLLKAGRFHADLIVIGTKSSRMSGTSGFNAQGVRRAEETRACFTLGDGDLVLCGGDFSGFEVNLMDAAYGDPALREELMSGKKIHALFGQYLFPGKSYDDIVATKGLPGEQDIYTRSKNGVFALAYGGEAHTLVNRVGISKEAAEDAFQRWCKKYKVWAQERRKIFDLFCVTKDTWVQTTDGPRQVIDIVDKSIKIVANGIIVQTDGFFASGRKEVFKIETKEGYSITASEDHPLLAVYLEDKRRDAEPLTFWKKVKTLSIGDKIKLSKQLDLSWGGDGTFKEGYLLGWLIGDGTIYDKRSRLIFYPPDYHLMNIVSSYFANYPEVHKITNSDAMYMTSDELDSLVQEYGITKHKQLTTKIEEASSDFYCGFLQAFFDADSSCRYDRKQIELHQSNRERLIIVQRMLARLGIVSKIRTVSTKTKGVIQGRDVILKPAYKLYIGASNVEIFMERIGYLHNEKKQNVKTAMELCHKNKHYREFYTAEISSIESIGEKYVYDIHVPEIHYFDANGILAHNCSMQQPNGIGTKVEWHEPAEYIESLFGFRRYFNLENEICKALFFLAENPPEEWQRIKFKVVRRDREQTACGALRSALFAAAFAVQAANMRAAGNHVIQSSGSQLCKSLQRRIWDLQPTGINKWRVQPLNIHDEIMAPAIKEIIPDIRKIVEDFIIEGKEKVPLLEIEWHDKLESWAGK